MGKRRILEAIVLSCVLGVGTVSTRAEPLTLFDTGVNDSGQTLPDGATDPNYFLLGVPNGPTPPVQQSAFVNISSLLFPSVYIPADPVGQPGSEWISGPLPGQGSQDVGNYDYRTLFSFPANTGNLLTAQITGNVAADNTVTIFLNGHQEQGPIAGFGSYTKFSITTVNDFIPNAVNFIDFVVDNTPGGPPPNNPQGLRVDGITGSFTTGVGGAVPEPASLILCLTGISMVAAGTMARRRWRAGKA
jgi:hypothetical protein